MAAMAKDNLQATKYFGDNLCSESVDVSPQYQEIYFSKVSG